MYSASVFTEGENGTIQQTSSSERGMDTDSDKSSHNPIPDDF